MRADWWVCVVVVLFVGLGAAAPDATAKAIAGSQRFDYELRATFEGGSLVTRFRHPATYAGAETNTCPRDGFCATLSDGGANPSDFYMAGNVTILGEDFEFSTLLHPIPDVPAYNKWPNIMRFYGFVDTPDLENSFIAIFNRRPIEDPLTPWTGSLRTVGAFRGGYFYARAWQDGRFPELEFDEYVVPLTDASIVSTVPLPAGAVLLGSGVVGLGALAARSSRRRRSELPR